MLNKKSADGNPGDWRHVQPKMKKSKALWDKREENDIWESLDSEIRTTQTTDTIEISVASEVSKYLRMPNQPRKSDPLKWWRATGQYLYPNLWIVAKKYLCIPATSVPSERGMYLFRVLYHMVVFSVTRSKRSKFPSHTVIF